jgi:hypothetical protein
VPFSYQPQSAGVEDGLKWPEESSAFARNPEMA